MITSTSNQKMKRLVNLSQKAKVRRQEGVFIVEGPRMFVEAPKDWVKEVYVSESFYNTTKIKDKINQFSYEIVADDVFKKVSNTITPQGILSVLKQPSYDFEKLFKKEKPLFVVLEDIQDPGNLGTIFRTGEGAGIDGIIMSKDTVDVFNPKVTRSTMGSLYRMPFMYVEDLHTTIDQLKNNKIKVFAAHLNGNNYYEKESFVEGTAFLIGNEGNGLKKETADRADSYIKIPMEGQVESLNAAIATALLMYEAHRQRRGGTDMT